MYRCQLCQCVVGPRIPSHHQVLKQRRKKYHPRSKANKFKRMNKDGKKKEYTTDDPGGEGREIVREVNVCPDCTSRNGNG